MTVATSDGAQSRGHAMRLLRTVAALAILAALGIVVFRERQAFLSLGGLPPANLGLIVAGTLGAWAANVASVRLLLGLHGLRLPFGELHALHASAGLLNHLPFRTGTAFRALYYRRRTGLPWSSVGSVMTLHALTQIAAVGVVGGVAALFAVNVPTGLVLGFAALAVLPALAFVPAFRPKGRTTRLGRAWDRVASEMALARRGAPRLVGSLVLGCIGAAFGGLRLWAAFDAIGLEVAAAEATIVGCAGSLALVVSITPAGLGVAEFLTVGLGTLVDVASGDGLVAAVVVRAVITACFVLVGVPSLALLRRRLGVDG